MRRLEMLLVVGSIVLGCAPSPQPASSPDVPAPGTSVSPREVLRDTLAPIQLDQAIYVMERTPIEWRTRVVATYRNRSADPVYLGRCGERPPRFYVEKWTEGKWRRVYSEVCTASFSAEPTVVAPSETRTDTLTLHHFNPGSRPRFTDEDFVGSSYRLVYIVYGTWEPERTGVISPEEPEATEPGELLPKEMRVSEPFQLRMGGGR